MGASFIFPWIFSFLLTALLHLGFAAPAPFFLTEQEPQEQTSTQVSWDDHAPLSGVLSTPTESPVNHPRGFSGKEKSSANLLVLGCPVLPLALATCKLAPQLVHTRTQALYLLHSVLLI